MKIQFLGHIRIINFKFSKIKNAHFNHNRIFKIKHFKTINNYINQYFFALYSLENHLVST